MKEFKPLTESQIELLQAKIQQIQSLMQQARALQNQNSAHIERMKTELGISAKDAKQWQFSKDGKSFEREKKIKKTTVKDNKKKK